jgi:hypothetical protein
MLMDCVRRLSSQSFFTYKSTTQLHAILTSSSIIGIRASIVELNDDNGGRTPIASRAVIAYVSVVGSVVVLSGLLHLETSHL